MKKTIEKLLSKKELKKMSESDAIEEKKLSNISPTEDLLKRYNVVNKIEESSLKLPSKKRLSIDTVSSNQPNVQREETDFIEEEKEIINYEALKENLTRLESYEELAKQYQLTSQQMENVEQIYNVMKEAEKKAENLSGQYRQMSDQIKEMAETTKRMMDEISGSYIKDISEYRHSG